MAIDLEFRNVPVDSGDGAAMVDALAAEMRDLHWDVGHRQAHAQRMSEAQDCRPIANVNAVPVAPCFGEK